MVDQMKSVQRSGSVSQVSSAKASNTAATALLQSARKHLGEHEGANNANPYTKHVMGDAHQPWCAAFVSTMLENANIAGVSKKMFSASARGLAGQFQHAGRYFASGSKQPQPGDVIFFGGRGSEHHTGIVQKVENGKVYTIEGNSSDQVSERVYSLNDPGIGGYGRVFGEGDVSGDLGFDVSKAGHGKAGGTPAGRAHGRGSTNRATETGVDASAYTNFGRSWVLALLEAMLNGDAQAIQAALEGMFPYASVEDLGELAKTLQANPDLAAKIGSNPELLQQLIANPSPEAVKALVDAPRDTSAASPETIALVNDLLNSTKLADRPKAFATLMPLLRQVDTAKGNGWAPRASVSSGQADTKWTP